MTRDAATRDQILKLFNDGWSGAKIARMIGNGETRNSIIGVVHRARRAGATMRTGQSSGSRLFVLATPKTKTKPKPPSLPGPDVAAPDARLKNDGTHVGTADLRDGDCRWPHGEVGAADFHYCALKKHPGSPYCPYHAARAWRPHSGKAA